MVNYTACTILSIIIFILIGKSASGQQHFTDVSKYAGIHHQFVVFKGTFGGGATVLDLNNDGYQDVFIAGGKAEDALYLNNRDGTFTNIIQTSGLKTKVKIITQGAVSADVNKDGWVDLYVTNITTDTTGAIPRAPNRLYINNGNNTFTDATELYRLGDFQSFSTGAAFGDFNADGFPDLFVGNYFKEYSGELNILNDAIIVGSNQMAQPYLFLNVGGKYFRNVYADYGLSQKGFGFGGVFSDFDNDGNVDLLVNNDFGYKANPNQLLQNLYPRESFLDRGTDLHMNLGINAMGTAVGDYNNDGLLDYFVTNIRDNQFMVNQGPGKPFINKSRELGTAINRLKDGFGNHLPISWGANFADFDNDGDLDLFVANGCLNPNVEPMHSFYFENGNGKYFERSGEVGLSVPGIGRGSVTFDYDNDGDQDLLVVNQKPVSDIFNDAATTRLFRNDSVQGNWIEIALTGIEADKKGIGARIEIVVGKRKLIREIDGGSSHESQNSTVAHFGIGHSTLVDSVIVRWVGGKTQVLVNQQVNQILKITEIRNYKMQFIIFKIFAVVAGLSILSYLYLRKGNPFSLKGPP